MPAQPTFVTPYDEANALLATLLADVQAVLGCYFVGLYVHGSLAGGDFNTDTSDIDFLVATTDELPAELLPDLRAMHARITTGGLPWAAKLEGSYISRQALRRYDPAQASHPALRVDGSFEVDGHGPDWVIQRHILRERGVALAGPPLSSLIDPVEPDAIRRAAYGILVEWWAPQLEDHSRLQSSEYQAYAVLTMCRALYTLQFATVASKPEAARWALATLESRWHRLIEHALAWRHGMEMDSLAETLDLIRHTLDAAKSK